jgi:twitching motility protein PilT
MEITSLLARCASHAASDCHLAPFLPPIARINGNLHRLDLPVMDPLQLDAILLNCMDEQQHARFDCNQACDFHFPVDRLTHSRAHVYRQRHGMAAAFRLIPARPPTLEQLELPAILQQIARCKQGLVLITGACGSGKSSTLAAMIDFRNSLGACHIVTMEDPIEFLHDSKQALVSQRELDFLAKDQSRALRAALREDPDILVIGEMRDEASIALALEAAETGHLVLATLHARSTRDAIARIVAGSPLVSQELTRIRLSQSLTAVFAQALPRSRDGSRRFVAHEILLATRAVRNLIRENRLQQIESLLQTGQHTGMHTLGQSLQDLVQQQKISPEEALLHAGEHDWVVENQHSGY